MIDILVPWRHRMEHKSKKGQKRNGNRKRKLKRMAKGKK
jgi:hypothetical protein